MQFKLISHALCPYAQRVNIVLTESGIAFERVDIDLSSKPDWLLRISPLAKVPVLQIDEDVALFESTIIAHYVHDVCGGDLLSANLLEKYQQLAWAEVASEVLADIGRLYSAKNLEQFTAAMQSIERKFLIVEQELGRGDWFAYGPFTLVDAAFAPAFRYFNVLNDVLEHDVFAHFPSISQWRDRLLDRPSVKAAVSDDYDEKLLTFLKARDSLVGAKANKH
ncbi:glutathione S-transferase family protein [Alteromonadaceae bacterium M269]|nr:glutathione S-transferase family protein [Alteromonadaceae bacterium M269]